MNAIDEKHKVENSINIHDEHNDDGKNATNDDKYEYHNRSYKNDFEND